MRKTWAFIMVATIVAILFSACHKCPKCKPAVRVSYLVPEFVCPVPSDPVLKPITPEIVQDDLMFKKVMGDNLITMQQSLAMWRGVYYECIQNIIRLYKNEADKVNAENADIEENMLTPNR